MNKTVTPVNGMEILILEPLILITAVGGLVGNAAVLWLLGFCLQRNPFSVYILNLAGADFLCLCSLIIHSLIKFSGFSYTTPYFIHYFLHVVILFSYIAGLSLLSAVSTKRCLSALYPIWYHCHQPKHLPAVICALIWSMSLFLSILEWNFCISMIMHSKVNWCRNINFFLATWLIFLFVVLCGSSLALLVKMFCGSQKKKLTSFYVTIVLTVLIFLLCGLPFGIYYFLLFWIPRTSIKLHYPWFLLLSCFNSSANPIIYFFVGFFRQRRLQPTLKKVLQRALQDIPKMDEPGGNLPQESVERSGSNEM
ncbi:PREDICTED: mas-related G-protein coupled receptor member X1-like [Elephantulus edwardii]|uniref:mas-related G-protein coupled receptor member X1-like n=1 Tax=Elephantulus edwardii TaxID=28737 RepID=UPI0003F0A6B5|nr:PREDICTED: mas-related G-protein coupled receptor member X1-like [Elephantulus edwardii]